MICGYEGRLWEGMRGGNRSVHFFLKRAFTSCVYPSHRTHKRHVFAILAVILMLWASLTDIADKHENHQGTTLIVLKNYFVKLTKKVETSDHFKKTGRNPKSKTSRNKTAYKVKK